jgi:hypothetical protein
MVGLPTAAAYLSCHEEYGSRVIASGICTKIGFESGVTDALSMLAVYNHVYIQVVSLKDEVCGKAEAFRNSHSPASALQVFSLPFVILFYSTGI